MTSIVCVCVFSGNSTFTAFDSIRTSSYRSFSIQPSVCNWLKRGWKKGKKRKKQFGRLLLNTQGFYYTYCTVRFLYVVILFMALVILPQLSATPITETLIKQVGQYDSVILYWCTVSLNKSSDQNWELPFRVPSCLSLIIHGAVKLLLICILCVYV